MTGPLAPLFAQVRSDAARMPVQHAEKNVGKEGAYPCRLCKQRHVLRANGRHLTWADPADGHAYFPLSRSAYLERLIEDFASSIERHVQDMQKLVEAGDDEIDRLERHVQDMETALGEIRLKAALSVKGGVAVQIVDLVDGVLPAREKGTECPAGHGSQCCGYPGECREAMEEAR